MTKVVLIDADIIAYSVGFAAQNDPVENALHSVKIMINKIVEACDADEYECFLTGKGNYREGIAVTKPYKGNRKQDKPTHYNAIREYLINVHGAVVVDGMEADDCLGYNQTENTVIATLDKDLDMIAGKHYNWRKDLLYSVTQDEADLFFYKQLLMGDSTDNIAGVPKIGPKKAEIIINSCMLDVEEDDFVEDNDALIFTERLDEEELYWTILEQYSLHYERPFEIMMEMATLLYIQREKGVLWTPKF